MFLAPIAGAGMLFALCRGENRLKQTRKTRLDVGAPQGVEATGANIALLDHSGLAQNLEMVRHCGFRGGLTKRAARHFAAFGQLAHDAKPDGVTQSVEHLRQGQTFARWVMQFSHLWFTLLTGYQNRA